MNYDANQNKNFQLLNNGVYVKNKIQFQQNDYCMPTNHRKLLSNQYILAVFTNSGSIVNSDLGFLGHEDEIKDIPGS